MNSRPKESGSGLIRNAMRCGVVHFVYHTHASTAPLVSATETPSVLLETKKFLWGTLVWVSLRTPVYGAVLAFLRKLDIFR